MRAPLAFTDDLLQRHDDQRKAAAATRYGRPGWLWVGYIVFGIAFWTGVGYGTRALIGVL